METTDKYTFVTVKNVFLSVLLCFLTGFLYSLGVFTTFVEEAANPPGSLDGVWPTGMALISLFCTPTMFFAGIYLSEGSISAHPEKFGESKSSRTRILAGVGSLFYALLAIAGYGVQINSPFLVQLSFIPVGCGMGLFYVEMMELLAVWIPDRPGFAIGIGQMMFGFGSIISSSIFEYLVRNYTLTNALYIAAAILSLPAAAATPFFSWPELGYMRTHETESSSLVAQPTPISWKQLVRLSSFWMYVITLFCLQVSYAFVAYYFKIGKTFGKDVSTLVTSYQVANIAGTLLRPMTGALVDIVKTAEGFFNMGSKNMMLFIFVFQGIAFLALLPASWMNWFEGYAIFAGTCVALFSAGSCCAPLLAREQFGSVNSSVVFGAGGSLSMGLGETGAVLMMVAVERLSSKLDAPSAYQGYYVLSLLWTGLGFVTAVMMKVERFEWEPRGEWVESEMSFDVEELEGGRHMRSNSYAVGRCGCGGYGGIDGALRSVKVS